MTTSTSRTPGRLAAVWFADIVGYTTLSAEDHPRALAIVDLFQDLARKHVSAHGGRVVKFIGDAALAEFASTTAAVQAAGELQRAFLARSAEVGRRTSLRIGVHLGEIEAAPDGDIYGDGVNTASRLQGAAEPGHVLVSEDVWRSLRSHPEFEFEPAGRRRLRGTGLPMAVFEAVPRRPADANGARQRKPGLTWLRGWRLALLLGAHAAIGGAVLFGIRRMVVRSATPQLTFDLALLWYLGIFPLILLVGWFHGYRRHRKATRGEKVLAGALLLVLGVLSVNAVSNHVERERAFAAATASGLDNTRIAVLYFEDLRGDTAQAYLAAGLTEDLIDELTSVRALDVISANGVAPFRDRAVRPDSIAQILQAGTIVDGSVERRGEMLRVNVRLVDGATGAALDQRTTFEVPADDVFGLRAELVERVAGFLRQRLGEEVAVRALRSGTDDPAAWALVQRADQARARGEMALAHGDGSAGFAAYQAADSLLAQAEALDEDWAEPPVMRGWIAYELSRASHDPHEGAEWTGVALTHAGTALERDANDPAALELRGTVRYYQYLLNLAPDADAHQALLRAARADLEQAVSIDPSRAGAHNTLSHLYYEVQDVVQAVLSAQKAYVEDAYLRFADGVLWRLFNGTLDLGQFTQAERWCNEGGERFPSDHRFRLCRLILMVTPAGRPDAELAWRLAAEVDSLAPPAAREYERVRSELFVGGALANAGMLDSARNVLLRARGRVTFAIDPHQELLAYEAYMRTLTGETDEASSLLQRYYAANPGHLAGSSDMAWWWRSLANEPWFQQLLHD